MLRGPAVFVRHIGREKDPAAEAAPDRAREFINTFGGIRSEVACDMQ